MTERTNLQERFVTVQLTLLSIVVALILESLLGVLFQLEQWSLLVMVQSADVLTSALAMWIGFALGIAAADKTPHIMDFLGPFALLITLNLAVRYIATEQFVGFLLSGAAASTTAAASLWLDSRAARRIGKQGPDTTIRLLVAVALIEATIALLLLSGIITTAIGIALLMVSTAIQIFGVARSIHFWQLSLTPTAAVTEDS
ncbi:MAG: hypothetical protein AB8B93_02230 [Pseudomonadales bacterium]